MFSHLPVNVSEESFDIYDGLSGYFDDTVDFQGRKAKMEVSLVDLPPILQIQLQVRATQQFIIRFFCSNPDCSGSSLIVTHSSRTNRMPMSVLAKRCIWTVF